MTDTKWRISGGLGEPVDPVQKMTQGLGFPLRPVDNVPPPDTGDLFENVPVAEGVFMAWMGEYQYGLVYPKGSVVSDDGWLMVANKNTLAEAAPKPLGDPEWSMPDAPVFNTENAQAVVYTGHLYEFTTAGWLKGIRVWAPTLSGTTNYRIILLDVTDPNNPKYRPVEEPVLIEDDWTVVSRFDLIVPVGSRLLLYLDALNSGASTVINGGWTYTGTDQSTGPAVGNWNNDNQQITLRVNKTDLDGTDRATELLGAVPGTDFSFIETLDTNYSIAYRSTEAGVDQGTYVQYNNVLLTDTGPAGTPRIGNTTTMTANVPVPLPTDYVELPGGVPTPTWATVTGYRAFDGEEDGGSGNGYGVDFLFEEAVISPDWDLMSVPGV